MVAQFDPRGTVDGMDEDADGDTGRIDQWAARSRPQRPWWGNPMLWLAVSAVFLLLGLFVAPHFLGGTVIFLPFLWIWRPGGGGARRGRTGHGLRPARGSDRTGR